jgi:enoyl-CoA hydratase
MRAAMEMMVTGDSISGTQAVELGWANRAFPEADLDDEVLRIAKRIALLPPDIVQLNKRTVHRAMDHMGLRQSIRAGTDLCALGIHQESFEVFLAEMRTKGLTAALQHRDEPFGDYRAGKG